jgi:hypothetical protein
MAAKAYVVWREPIDAQPYRLQDSVANRLF